MHLCVQCLIGAALQRWLCCPVMGFSEAGKVLPLHFHSRAAATQSSQQVSGEDTCRAQSVCQVLFTSDPALLFVQRS